MKNRTAKGYIINTAVIAAVLIGFSVLKGALGDSQIFKLIMVPSLWQCCYLIILAASLNLVLGFLGQLSLGHCGFMAIGAYSAALISLACERAGIFADKSSPAFILVLLCCILAAGILAALVGLLVGIPALRLKGDYLAIITLGFGMIIVNIINNLPFAGQEGLSIGSPPPPPLQKRARLRHSVEGHVCMGGYNRYSNLSCDDVYVHPLQVRTRHQGNT